MQTNECLLNQSLETMYFLFRAMLSYSYKGWYSFFFNIKGGWYMTYTVFYIIFVMVLFLPKTFIFIDVLSHMTKKKEKEKHSLKLHCFNSLNFHLIMHMVCVNIQGTHGQTHPCTLSQNVCGVTTWFWNYIIFSSFFLNGELHSN